VRFGAAESLLAAATLAALFANDVKPPAALFANDVKPPAALFANDVKPPAALFANDGKPPARSQMYANQIYVGKRPQPPVPLPRAPAVKRQR
jgi:hypothetical protein